MLYRVNNLYTCVQGEGTLAGTAMVLLRLHGCGVGCIWCDTGETWFVRNEDKVNNLEQALGTNTRFVEMSAQAIAQIIVEQHKGPKWVLVTGGEPTEQPLKPLVTELQRSGYRVALETSGTANGGVGASINWVCVSPKIDNPNGKPLLPEVIFEADELKFIVGKEADLEKVDRFLATFRYKESTQILLQPLSLNPKATKLCIETVQNRGWRLSIQTHKYLDLP
ncbi:MAG: 7-carboxy-7-deazaguanine synthase QueE [Chloroflexi bacterium]|uniref:7-carboxy-7-deazaguanine synthase n=1 Tax=Candidatus Chlorohelix allophototropha TaxID=3003348 RepID=A0A8T7M0A0_9CHLR|nr:7-carboxy-7-deazaguanine synthase QueE [Chloroflexota bacterium]WJW67203.1 7-carboxy-7-deazaguanine synthase QueE [Chloroflexota bacterium L227-S17]